MPIIMYNVTHIFECCETCRRLSFNIIAISRSYKSPTLWSLPFPFTERHAATSFALGISGTLRSMNNMTLPRSRKQTRICLSHWIWPAPIKYYITNIRYVPLYLQCRHNGCDSVSNHQPPDCLLNPLFRHRSKKTPTLRVIGLCVGNSPGTDTFPAQMASNAENVPIWWRFHVCMNDCP